MKGNLRWMMVVLGSLPFGILGLMSEGAIATPLEIQHREESFTAVEGDQLRLFNESSLPISNVDGSHALTVPTESTAALSILNLTRADAHPRGVDSHPTEEHAAALLADSTESLEQMAGLPPAESFPTESASTETPTDGQATNGQRPDSQSDGVSEEEPAAEPTESTGDESAAEATSGESAEETVSDEADDELSEADARWRQLLIEGDRLFLQGDYLAAEQRYQEAKDPNNEHPDPIERPDAYADPELLPPAGQVYWREYQAGLESGLDTRITIPLKLLSEQYPEFIPGQIDYALLLSESEDEDAKQEAAEQLEQGTALFPDNAELARARVDFLAQDEQWLQAAIAARQFTILNPDAPENPEFQADADDYQRRFRSQLRGRLTRNAIGNALTGAVGVALTGNPFGAFSAIETTVLMLRGESAVGRSIAHRAVEELDLIEDEEVVAYVNEIGYELASLAGRDEFEYEFYVVEESELNAFALPGGKIFVNAGAILKAETEAELAGLIAHELAHAVLSHGFQLVTRGNLTANIFQFIPFGGFATNLAVLRYSRGMERQADVLGTQLLANSDYAADGLHRLMVTLNQESDRRSRFDWLSTHPDTPERVRNLDRLIDNNGYNRYAYEGIERHLRIQDRVERLLREADKLDEEDGFVIEDNTTREDASDADEPTPSPQEDSNTDATDAEGSDAQAVP